MQHTLIIQCLNYFEYTTLKEELVKMQWSMPIQYMDSTYTFRIPAPTSYSFEATVKQHAPTAKLTKKFIHKGRAIYTKLKD